MSRESTQLEFQPLYAQQLQEFVDLMAQLWQEHRTSPTNAGSEEFYAWGNMDYVVVMSAHKFDDLVEIKSKFGNIDIKRDEQGLLGCLPGHDEKEAASTTTKKGTGQPTYKVALPPEEILKRTTAALKSYYYSKMA